jgi:hypothetical protein
MALGSSIGTKNGTQFGVWGDTNASKREAVVQGNKKLIEVVSLQSPVVAMLAA